MNQTKISSKSIRQKPVNKLIKQTSKVLLTYKNFKLSSINIYQVIEHMKKYLLPENPGVTSSRPSEQMISGTNTWSRKFLNADSIIRIGNSKYRRERSRWTKSNVSIIFGFFVECDW